MRPQAPIFCLACGYPLDDALVECRCSECGRPFDPADDRTFDRTGVSANARRWTRRLNAPLFWLFAGSILIPTADHVVMNDRAGIHVMTLLVGLVTVVWYQQDAWRRGRRPRGLLSILMFLIPPVVLPIYAIKTYGWRGVWVVLTALSLLAAAACLYLATSFLVTLLLP